MRLIDADALMETIGITKECKDCARNGVRGCSESSAFVWACESITEAPTIDAVPVVRCRDCKFWRDDNPRVNGYHCCYRMHNIFPMKESDYCSHGERKAAESE